MSFFYPSFFFFRTLYSKTQRQLFLVILNYSQSLPLLSRTWSLLSPFHLACSFSLFLFYFTQSFLLTLPRTPLVPCLYPTCTPSLYCTCILLVSYSYPTCIVLLGPFHLFLLDLACINLLVYFMLPCLFFYTSLYLFCLACVFFTQNLFQKRHNPLFPFPSSVSGATIVYFMYYYSFSIHFHDHLAIILNVTVGFLSLFYLSLF